MPVEDTYNELKDFEARNDQAQAGLRQIASGWMLATIGAIAFVATQTNLCDETGALKNVVLIVIANLAASGLWLLWWLDQRVYQSLLHSAFIEGLRYEIRHEAEVLPVRRMMYKAHRNLSPKIVVFYLVPVVVLLLVTASAPFELFVASCRTFFAGSDKSIPAATLALPPKYFSLPLLGLISLHMLTDVARWLLLRAAPQRRLLGRSGFRKKVDLYEDERLRTFVERPDDWKPDAERKPDAEQP